MTCSRYGLPAPLINAAAALLALVVAGLCPVGGAGGAGAAEPAAPPVRLVVLGDSLTAGYGLPRADAFPARLEQALRAEGLAVSVIDAGVSGDTTAGGRARLGWALGRTPGEAPDAVIVELGANDALRGLDPEEAYRNLDAILTELGRRGIPVLLAGMLAPPNMGSAYASRFAAIYPRLAKQHGVALYPFFLDGVAGDPALNQADGIHPNARGVAEIVRRITPAAADLVRRAAADRPR
jgi:acyl-CoA thioesterase-1